jgi:hypothetical protein
MKTTLELSRTLGIDEHCRLRWQSSDKLAFEVVGCRDDETLRIDFTTAAPSTMPYAVNDFAQPVRTISTTALSHNGPAEAEDYQQPSKVSLWDALRFIGLLCLFVGMLLLSSCCAAYRPRHNPKPAALGLADPEPGSPTH